GTAHASVTSANGATTFVTRVIQGGSANATPIQWFSSGPAPINSGLIFNGGPGTLADVTGRVTGVVTDPTDANNIYISSAGGGAWKTTNNGQTWTPLFDGV